MIDEALAGNWQEAALYFYHHFISPLPLYYDEEDILG